MRKISLNSVLCGRRLQGFGAPGYMATTVALQVGLCPTSNFSASQIRSHVSSGSKVPAVFPALKCKERAGLLRWKETRVSPVVVGAASPSFDAFDSGPSTSGLLISLDYSDSIMSLIRTDHVGFVFYSILLLNLDGIQRICGS